jgi:predicted PurR-regulated permease PerM
MAPEEVKAPQPQPEAPEAQPLPAVVPPPAPPPEEKAELPSQFARLFLGAVTLLVLYYAYEITKPYLIDFLLALVLFFTFKPLHRALSRLFYGRQALASAVTCLLLALLVLIPLFTLASLVASQALELYSSVNQGLQDGHLWQWVSGKVTRLQDYLAHLNLPLPPEQIKLEQIVQTVLARASQFIYANAVGLIKGFTSFFFDLLLVLFIAFFMFLQGDDFIEEVKKLSPLEESHNKEILHEMEATIKATLRGTVVVAVVQGILGGVGFFVFGVPQAAFWGTVMVPAAVIPLVGSAVIWLPAAIYLMFIGHVWAGLGLIIWGGVLVSAIDNVLKPLLMKGSRATPSIFILFSILGGISYFGMIGFILGPLILSFLLSLLRIYQKTILARPAAAPAAARPDQK